MKNATPKEGGPDAVNLIEEAVHLLRRHPQELAVYYATVGPFAVGLLYFWAYLTWFTPPEGAIAVGALVLAVLFGVMKAGQHRFATCLRARRAGDVPLSWTGRHWLGEFASQLRLQASGLVLVPLAALFTVPFGWIYGYYQTATVLPSAGRDSATRRNLAWKQALLWPKQNHWALLIFSLLWLMIFLNLAVAFYFVPTLITRWFGLKTSFALQGWAYFNTTFLALVCGLTHLVADPLIKTFYLLRVFHGEARDTGADLRLVLARERSANRRSVAVALALLLAGTSLLSPRVRGGETGALPPTPPLSRVSVSSLDGSLDRVLKEPDFQWRLRPPPPPAGQVKDGVVTGFIRSTFAVINQMIHTVIRWIDRARRWVADLLPGGKDGKEKSDPEGADSAKMKSLSWMAVLQTVSVVLLVAVVALLIFVAWKVWRHDRLPPLAAPTVPAPATPDLRDERVEASRLPADGWLALAREKMAAGEWRLALRALFLATLARHAHQGLVSLAKFKTNLDYEIELRRRAHSRTALVEDFRGRRREFESVWYGSAPVSDAAVREWLQRLEDPA